MWKERGDILLTSCMGNWITISSDFIGSIKNIFEWYIIVKNIQNLKVPHNSTKDVHEHTLITIVIVNLINKKKENVQVIFKNFKN